MFSTRAMIGHPGVHNKRDNWVAIITYQQTIDQPGSYKSIDEAIAVRQDAEKML